MLTLLIIIFLAIGFYSGARRGLVLQIVYTIGYIISMIVAKMYYRELASKIELYIPYPSATAESKFVLFNQSVVFELDQAFYAASAFLIILFGGWLVTKFIGMLCHKLTFIPLVKQVNSLGGGLLNLVVVYVGIFLFLTIFAMIPLDFVQNLYRNSGFARMIVNDTPFFSKAIYDWWVTSVIS